RLEHRRIDPHPGRVRRVDRALRDRRTRPVDQGHLAAVGERLGEERPDHARRALDRLAVRWRRPDELRVGGHSQWLCDEQETPKRQRGPQPAIGGMTVHWAESTATPLSPPRGRTRYDA